MYTYQTYSDLMADTPAFLTITLDLDEPMEVEDFAKLFATVAQQFDEYVEREHPTVSGEAKIYIKELRKGSVIADLVPMMTSLIDHMDKVLIVTGFAALLSKRVRKYIQGEWLAGASKADLAEIKDMVQIVAKNKGGEAQIETVKYEQGVLSRSLELSFTTKEARKAVETLEAHKVELDKRESADHENVLMVFIQANVKAPELGKRSGEQVTIEKIDRKPRAISYESELARQKIKGEIDAAGENVFKKGFFVDVNVEYLRGRIAAYKIKAVRDVIDLPEDDG